jgi:predicted kinase
MTPHSPVTEQTFWELCAMTEPKPMLHFMCGKAGAGKSTLAKKIASAEKAFLISEDIFLTRLYGLEMKSFDDYLVFSKRLKTVIEPLVTDLLFAGHSVVLDFPANTMKSREWFRSIFSYANASHQLHFIDIPESICLERIAERNVNLPEGSHQLTVDQFNYITSFFEAPRSFEGFNIRTYFPD